MKLSIVLAGILAVIIGTAMLAESAYNSCPSNSPIWRSPVASNPFYNSACNYCLAFSEPYFLFAIVLLVAGVALGLIGLIMVRSHQPKVSKEKLENLS